AAAVQGAGVILEGRDPRQQAIDEPGDLRGRELLEDAEVDEQLDDRRARPVVRAAQDPRLEDLERGQGLRSGGTRLLGGGSLGGGGRRSTVALAADRARI